MLRIPVDFNSMMRDPEERVELGIVGSWQADRLPPSLTVGDRVILFDEEMEVEAVVEFEEINGLQVWMGRPDWATRRDLERAV